MSKKIMASLMTLILLGSMPVYGQPPVDAKTPIPTQEVQKESSTLEAKKLTLDEAITMGLQNSLMIKEIKNQIGLSKIISNNATDIQYDLENAEDDLEQAHEMISGGRNQIYTSQAQLDSAQAKLDNGLAPTPIPVVKPEYKLNTTIPEGTNIYEHIKSYYLKLGLDEGTATHYADLIAPAVEQAAQSALDQAKSQLSDSKKKLEASTEAYLSSEAKYQAALQFAMGNVADKLSTNTISSLSAKPLGSLIVRMATTQDEVMGYSENILKNQVALLIEKSYTDALKEQKLLEVKAKAMERGKMQYELAQAAYEVGGKSKDDMILAQTYYSSAVVAWELQNKDYQTSLIELKKNINMDLKEPIVLQAIEAGSWEAFDVEKGVESGLNLRLEIKMNAAQSKVYDYLLEAVNQSDYSREDAQYKEVKMLQEKAQIKMEQAKLEVESDIRSSYETMVAMGKVVEKTESLRESAKETLEIAKVKYEVGYGYDNALLKQLNLEDMAGTSVEVINAEENLVNIEEKAIEAINGYNLAKMKYLNDIGILPYK